MTLSGNSAFKASKKLAKKRDTEAYDDKNTYR